MLIKPPADIPSSEITDKKVYLNRREFIRAAGGLIVRPSREKRQPQFKGETPLPSLCCKGVTRQRGALNLGSCG